MVLPPLWSTHRTFYWGTMAARYEVIEELPGTELFRLERIRLAADGAQVLRKIPRQTNPPSNDVETLWRERELIESLALAGVPRLFGGTGGEAALLLHDPGGVPLPRLTAQAAADLPLTLAIAIRLATVLEALHRRGLIHHGLRSSAILCNAGNAEVCLIDFSSVSEFGTSPAQLPRSDTLERLIYVAPEQTGRMNRASDHRADLYSLGVLLYELLTGAPPFRSADALELIHWHIARAPVAPTTMNPVIPQVVSDLVMRLLAKNAEDRYQSAHGLLGDLRECARQWDTNRSIAGFTLGKYDTGDRFIVSPKLYGRQDELALLQGAFERMCRGETTLPTVVLVAGYAGIGKTALIQELYKPIARQRGYFVSGKFDQVVRNIPFGALIQAFRSLVQQLLTESEARLADWRRSLAVALGVNGGVLAQVIPEIELIIGKQPFTVVLGSTETLNRFQLVLRNFVSVLARPEHPLVVFLDDLQWADAATLSLLEPLLLSPEASNLFLMGAYRDNEVDAGHALRRTFGALEANGVELQRVTLGPLRLPDLTQLISDTLRCDTTEAEPLARLVLQKTAGNPFFVTQFLTTLKQEGYFQFDYDQERWSYQLAAVAGAPLTENVIDLMARKIRRLPAPTQRALTLAACIGNAFNQSTLAIVSEQSATQTVEDLRQALSEGLIVATQAVGANELSYTFLHDRVQHAAYALIPQDQRRSVHLTVGRLLCSQAGAESLEEHIFELVHHLNLGQGLIAAETERVELARLNLHAGRKAKASTAYDAALDYLKAALSLLAERHWRSDYELLFSLELETAEAEYLCGRFDDAQQRLTPLLERAVSKLDKAKVYRMRSLEYENLARYADALDSAHQALALFGVVFPHSAQDKEALLEREIALIQTHLGVRSIGSLAQLPAMQQPETRMVMSIMTEMWASAYLLGDPTLARLISATMVRLSLESGNVEESAYGYVTHAMTIALRGDYPAAHEFGTLALAVNEQFHDTRRRAKIYQQFQAHVNFWCRPFHTCIPYAREACRSALESGDFLYATYGAATQLWSAMVTTQDLGQFVRDYAPTVALVRSLKNPPFADSVAIILNWARALRGVSKASQMLSDETIDEAEYLERYRGNAFFTAIHAVSKLQVCYLLAEPEVALQAARTAAAVAHKVASTVWPVIFDFWHALTLAANYDTASSQQRDEYRAAINAAQSAFERLAQHCQENYHCPSLLLAAELARLDDQPMLALDKYEQAIGYARETNQLPWSALANELCARFHIARGQTKIAALYLSEARADYGKWGASAKVQVLEQRYAEILNIDGAVTQHSSMPRVSNAAAANAPADGSSFDLHSVIKAGQTIASEIQLERLLVKLIGIVIENAGAERASLVLERSGDLLVVAEGSVDAVTALPGNGTSLHQARSLPTSLVNYVWRTGENVVLADAQKDDRFGVDPYVTREQPRSVLCIPVLKHGRAIGVLYLENKMVVGAFTPDRIEVVQLLAAQAAISLENAQLFDGLKREIQERTRAEEKLRAAMVEVEHLKNELEAENTYLRRDLIANVSHDLRTPLTSLRGYLETLLLRQDSLSAAEHSNYLEIAVRQSERLGKLVDELFELAKLDFRGLQLDLAPLRIDELVYDVLQKFHLVAEQQQVRLGIEMAQGLPMVHADAGLLERVFDNLIGNALKHTPSGGQIGVCIHADSRCVTVSISDTGSGIAEADIPLIFDRFYRGDKSRGDNRGSAGLGLAIAKRIIELHHGEINVESKPQGGARFWFSIPIVLARADKVA